MASLRSWPRPAKPVPNPFSDSWIPRRVRASNMLKTWSISTGLGRAWARGTVAPVVKPARDRPGVSCTYLSPSAERGRIRIVLSTGSGSRSRSSFSCSRAVGLPPAFGHRA